MMPLRLTCRRFVAPVLVLLLAACFVTLAARADARTPRGSGTRVAKTQAGPWTFTVVNDPDALVACLLGTSIPVRSAALTAADSAAGTFVGGDAIVGFDGGVALSTGTIHGALGPNSEFGNSGKDNLVAGDPSLDLLVDPETTYDACVLQFEFFTEAPQEIEFDYVFGSEEYSEFVGAGFDDVLAFFLNGTAAAQNIARVTDPCATVTGVATSVDNVNCGNAFDPLVTPVNCNCYRDNEVDFTQFPPPPTPIDSEMDGFTKVFKARGTTRAGWNTLKIAVADAGDAILDSNVYIRCSSFVVPARPSSWGKVRTLYR